jgi:HSP90 family molecular chaperone
MKMMETKILCLFLLLCCCYLQIQAWICNSGPLNPICKVRQLTSVPKVNMLARNSLHFPKLFQLHMSTTEQLVSNVSPTLAVDTSATVVDAVPEPPVQEVPAERFNFESNVARVMDIIINSLYSNRDVFLRELVSNAADACDKKRFLCQSQGKPEGKLKIKIYSNMTTNMLTVEDNGIGMNKQDLINNLGRIAESGTKQFLEALSSKDKEDNALIGQFGVGFYSAFLVAKKIDVVSKGSDGEQLLWSASVGSLNSYTITKDLSSEPIEETGTKVILHLKDDADQYGDDLTLQALLEKYSEFVPFPIELLRNVTKTEEVPDDTQEQLPDGSYPLRSIKRRVAEWVIANEKKPLWMRMPSSCDTEDYESFYKTTFKAVDKPLASAHFSLEGSVDFRALLFIPTEVPFELTREIFAQSARQMRLYVKRVFINDNFEDLLPRWLIFLKGVVDSNDLPLNVGREILQQSRSLRVIKQRLTKKAIDMFHEVANRPNQDDYKKFWKNYGRYLKIGIIEEEKYRMDLLPLMRFHSSYDNEELISLADYVKRMKTDQQYIYFSSGETRYQASMSPSLERLKKNGYEVLFVSEPVDEMVLQYIETFGGKRIIDAAKDFPSSAGVDPSKPQNENSDGSIKTPEELKKIEEEKEKEKKNAEIADIREWIKDMLGNKITKVEASLRLVNSPATLIQSEYGISPNMQKYLKAQTIADNESGESSSFSKIFSQAVLELNADHPVISYLKMLCKKAPMSVEAKQYVDLLFSTAALSAGYTIDNSVEYSQQVVHLLTRLAKTETAPAVAAAPLAVASPPSHQEMMKNDEETTRFIQQEVQKSALMMEDALQSELADKFSSPQPPVKPSKSEVKKEYDPKQDSPEQVLMKREPVGVKEKAQSKESVQQEQPQQDEQVKQEPQQREDPFEKTA